MEKLLTIPEVCEVLGICRTSLYFNTKAGDIPCVRVGRHVRYSPEAVARAAREGLPARNVAAAQAEAR